MPEALIAIIPLYPLMGALLLYARREDVVRAGFDRDKATARAILLTPVWPAWLAYHVVRGLSIGLCWTFYNAFRGD